MNFRKTLFIWKLFCVSSHNEHKFMVYSFIYLFIATEVKNTKKKGYRLLHEQQDGLETVRGGHALYSGSAQYGFLR